MSDRLRQEIDEILSKYEKFPLREPLPRRLRRKAAELTAAAGQLLAAPLRYVTTGRLMLLGVILVLAAYFSWGGASITRSVVIAALLVFALAFIVSLRRRTPHVEQRWRGRPLDLHEPNVSTRLRAWWGRWRGGVARRDSLGPLTRADHPSRVRSSALFSPLLSSSPPATVPASPPELRPPSTSLTPTVAASPTPTVAASPTPTAATGGSASLVSGDEAYRHVRRAWLEDIGSRAAGSDAEFAAADYIATNSRPMASARSSSPSRWNIMSSRPPA